MSSVIVSSVLPLVDGSDIGHSYAQSFEPGKQRIRHGKMMQGSTLDIDEVKMHHEEASNEGIVFSILEERGEVTEVSDTLNYCFHVQMPVVKTLGKWKDRHMDVLGVKTHFIEAGQGETLMLVHGGGLFSCAEINWEFVIEPLAQQFHVIAADQIGFGYTPIPHKDYSLKARGDHLITFLETLNERKVHLVGNSHGGWLVTYISVKRPDLVKKLVVVNSGSASSPLTRDSPGIEKEFPTIFDKSSYTTPPTMESVREALMKNTYRKELVTIERVKKAYEIAVRNFETHKLRTEHTETSIEARNQNASIDGKHISEYTNQLKMPVLLIWGRHDEGVARLENGLRLLNRIPGAEMHIFDFAKHLPMVDQSERFVSVVTNFLKA